MKIFFDTEFTGLHKDTTLISIGLISEDGKTFYAELTDYDKSQVNPWIQDNVIDNLKFSKENWVLRGENYNENWHCCKSMLKGELKSWLSMFDSVQLISDVCHYDMVLFIDLFGTAFDLPTGINPSCHDINQDIARFYNCSEAAAFDLSREKILEKNNIVIEGHKHNALYDAKVIKEVYEIVK